MKFRFPRSCCWFFAVMSMPAFAGTAEDADSLLQSGHYAQALPLLLELGKTHEDPHSETELANAAAHALAMGQVYRQLENTDQSIVWLEKSEKWSRQHSLSSLLVLTLMERGEISLPTCQPWFEEAWSIAKQTDGIPELAALARLRLSEIQLTFANYEMSRALVLEALEWLNRAEHKNLASCQSCRFRALQDLGRWHLAVGDFPQAVTQFKLALDLSPKSSALLSDMAIAQWRSGNRDAASQAFREAIVAGAPSMRPAIEANLGATLLSWIPADASPEVLLEQASAALSMLPAQSTSPSAQLSRAEASRLRALAQSQLGNDPQPGWNSADEALNAFEKNPQVKSLPDFHPLKRHASVVRWTLEAVRNPALSNRHAKLALEQTFAQMRGVNLLKTGSPRLAFLDPLDPASPLMGIPESQRAKHAAALLGSFGLSSRQELQMHSLEEWSTSLPEDACLAAWFIFKKPVGQTWLNSVAALILDKTGAVQILDLELAADNLSRNLDQLRTLPTPDLSKEKMMLRKLGERLWKPVRAKFPSGTNKVFVFLEGALSAVPLGCLMVDDQSLLQGPIRCTHLASPDALFHHAGRSRPIRTGLWLGTDGTDVPAKFAAPAEGWPFPISILNGQSFPKLSSAAKELSLIQQANSNGWKIAGHSECEISKALAQKDVRVWHFAGHGAWQEAQPGLAPDYNGNCLLLHGASPGNEASTDGLWFGQEIASLNLAHLDLAVLSACDTGRGQSRHGEASFDLASAFHQAGVRDVLVSAAPVEDSVAPELMREFYRLLAAGIDPPDAAWDAQKLLQSTFPSIHSTGYFRLIRGNDSSP